MDTVFFVLSKLVWGLLRPESWFVLLALFVWLALWRGWQRVARRGVAVLSLALIALGFLPVGNLVLTPLEPPTPLPGSVTNPVAGIIILGGAEEREITRRHGVPSLNGAAERLTEGVRLARLHPKARVVYTGGSGALFPGDVSSSDVARDMLLGLGLAPERLTLEGASRTTWENALYTHRLLQPQAGETWVLVTSAFHMRRSLGAFCAVGWAVTPWPADYRVGPWRPIWDLAGHLEDLNSGTKEWIGLLAYRLTGRWKDPATCQ